MGIFENQIRMEASFTKDYEFNEFQFTCLVLYIEKYFDIKILPKDYIYLDTVGSTIGFVHSKLKPIDK